MQKVSDCIIGLASILEFFIHFLANRFCFLLAAILTIAGSTLAGEFVMEHVSELTLTVSIVFIIGLMVGYHSKNVKNATVFGVSLCCSMVCIYASYVGVCTIAITTLIQLISTIL